jgi:DNA-binding NarL/FixJ family response regulator
MIKILITDDHAVVRRGLRQIIGDVSDMVIAGEAENATEMLELLSKQDYSVLVLDISLPGRSGFDFVSQVKTVSPELPILVYTVHPEDQFAVRMLKAGASGYLTKDKPPEELIKAIRKVVSGGRYVSAALGEQLALGLGQDLARLPHETLAHREFQIMQLIVLGRMTKDIAKELCLSVKTVSTYRARALKKMKMKTNSELTRYAIKHNLLTP